MDLREDLQSESGKSSSDLEYSIFDYEKKSPDSEVQVSLSLKSEDKLCLDSSSDEVRLSNTEYNVILNFQGYYSSLLFCFSFIFLCLSFLFSRIRFNPDHPCVKSTDLKTVASPNR